MEKRKPSRRGKHEKFVGYKTMNQMNISGGKVKVIFGVEIRVRCRHPGYLGAPCNGTNPSTAVLNAKLGGTLTILGAIRHRTLSPSTVCAANKASTHR